LADGADSVQELKGIAVFHQLVAVHCAFLKAPSKRKFRGS